MVDEGLARLVAGSARLALVQKGRVVVLEVPSLAALADIGTGSDDYDAAFVGQGRLAVLARADGQSTLYLVDPAGPTKLGEVALRGTTRIAAADGDHVLAIGAASAVIVDTSQRKPVATPLPIREVVTAAGRLDAHRFVLVAGGVVQEWDAIRCAPLRRVRLDRPLDCRFVGGSAKRIWMVHRDQPDYIDLVSLESKSMRRIELPEGAELLEAHHAGDLLAMVGADTRSAYLVDLATRRPPKLVDRGPISNVAWTGHDTLALQAQSRALELVQIPIEEPRDFDLTDGGQTGRVRVKASVEEASSDPLDDVIPPPSPTARPRLERPVPVPTRRAPSGVEAPVAAEGPGWRADCARWARGANVGAPRELPLGMKPLDQACARLELDPTLRPALALLYGAYLAGERVAPLAFARTVGWRWSESLGEGTLARAGIARWHRGAIELADEVLAALDERGPVHGTLIAAAGTPRAVALLVPASVSLAALAEWAAATAAAGPLLAALDDAPLAGAVLEAKLRGALPLLRWTREHGAPPSAVLALTDAALAEELELELAGEHAA